MLPPKHPHSSNIIRQQRSPIINHHYNNRPASSSLDSRSRISKYQHLRTAQDKRKALGKKRYINQLAYLDYEDKQIQIHTKYTMVSKATAMKKIKAKNLLADFVDQQQEIQLGFQELMDYKYGKNTGDGNDFFFEKSQLTNEFTFCPQCDTINNDHYEVHMKICRQKTLISDQSEQYDKNSPFYILCSLSRIDVALKRTIGQEYDETKQIVKKMIRLQQRQSVDNENQNNNGLKMENMDLEKCFKQLLQIIHVNDSDKVLKGIITKIFKLYRRSVK